MFWNLDGTALQRVTHPPQKSLLGSLDDHRCAADSDQRIDRVLALQPGLCTVPEAALPG